mgnify:CR=1 FL=1
MNKKVAIILVNYKDYAEKYLAECLASLRRQNYSGEMKVFMVDNESTEESCRYLESVFNSPNPPLQGGQNTIPLTPFIKGVKI